jgi:hypothetical protein
MVIYQHWYYDRINFGIFDIIFILVLLLICYFYALNLKNQKHNSSEIYKNLPNAILIKILELDQLISLN